MSDRDGSVDELLADRSDPDARRRIVERYQRLADSLAERFVRAGTERDDARQVAALALVKAIDGFDTSRGTRFSTYAARTILGELKKARRDRSWDIHVPRSLQERWLAAARARDELTQELGRAPRIGEIAHRIGATPEAVLEAFDAGRSHSVGSLDRPMGTEPGRAVTVGERIGARDPNLVAAAARADVSEAIDQLEERDRRILYLRFYEGMTQSEIGAEIGVSQMHVSRLLRAALQELRQSAT